MGALVALTSMAPTLAITFDAASSAGAGAVAVVSWPHTVGNGADRMLVVGVTTESAPDALATSVTFGAQALTKVTNSRAVQGSPATATELWYLAAPNMGNATITVNLSPAVSSGNGTACGAVSLFGVKQAAPEAVATSATGSGTAYSLGITTLTDGAWLVDVVNSGAANASFTTNTSGMTERWDVNGDTQMAGACSTREVVTRGAVTDTWTSVGSGTKAQSIAAFAPVPAAQYVIVISVDGLGGTYLTKLFNGTATGGPYSIPNFTRLKNEGAGTLAGHCDNNNWETLPNHTSIVTARPRDNSTGFVGHGWSSNSDPAVGQTIHTNKGSYVAGVFDVAHDNGLRTGMYANKSKFSLFDTYGSYTGGGSYNATNGAADTILPDNGRDKVDNSYINTALGGIIVNTFITQQTNTSTRNRYAFIHINEPDANGHGSGWGSATWNASVVTVDGMLGKIFKLIETDVPAMKGKTAIILTADHGNQDNPPTGADRYQVPFYVWGPGVPAGADLYVMNSAIRQVASSYPMTTYAGKQPMRNAEANNVALDLLGLGAIPGSSFNLTQTLVVTAPAVTLAVAGSPLAEAAGVATVTATLSVPHTLPVTVNLAFAGTATLASDYTRSGTSISIPAGSRSGSIILTSVQDAVYDPNETIVVDISTVVNGSEDGTQQVTATITDPNRPPVFAGYAVSGTTNKALSIYPAKILARASDPDGDAITLTRVFSPSAQGGTVGLTGTVNYTPANNHVGTDTFEVELTDTKGASVRGTITVILTVAATGEGQNQTYFAIIDGQASMVFRGIPGRSYTIQRSIDDMVTWENLAQVTAGADGKIPYTDPPPLPPKAFYRTQSN